MKASLCIGGCVLLVILQGLVCLETYNDGDDRKGDITRKSRLLYRKKPPWLEHRRLVYVAGLVFVSLRNSSDTSTKFI